MLTPLYDSRLARYKAPFGAVRTGERVTFTVFVPNTQLQIQPLLKLFVMDRWDAPILHPLSCCGADLLYHQYRCTLVLEQPCLYAYHFTLDWEGQRRALKRGENGEGILDEHAGLWQLTVYDAAMQTPACLREGMLYQIFPDRFAYSGEKKDHVPADRILRQDWDGLPIWWPDEDGEITNADYFQGDLRGVMQKLAYLADLGVTVLYLNPIFEAHANHRYNTADYQAIDPLLGTEQDFRELCSAAKAQGISIILDGVFSHTGSDSVYFNKEKRYGDGGAFWDPESPYAAWYQFKQDRTQYDCWWGFSTLPNVREQEPSYLSFICGEDGVLRKWLAAGAAGYRLDVADELPDVFLDQLHGCVKAYDPDAAVIGEVWEDASNKVSYGVRRRYLLGGQLDSVMNYPFKDAVLDYIRWGTHQRLSSTILQVLENYPPPAIRALMNFLSTHDTVRAITQLAGEPLDNHDREWQQRHHVLTPEQYMHGVQLFKLATILQFGLPGMPCIYYGDEAGVCGYRDPFNRTCYPWGNEDRDLLQFVRTLGRFRREYPMFAEAAFLPYICSKQVYAFVREGRRFSAIFAVNRSETQQPFVLPQRFQEGTCIVCTGTYQEGILGAKSGGVWVSKG